MYNLYIIQGVLNYMTQLFSDKKLLKNISLILVYIAAALLAISDSGIQLLILIEIGPGSRTLRLIAMWLLFIKVLMTRYTRKEFALLAPIAALALYNYTALRTLITKFFSKHYFIVLYLLFCLLHYCLLGISEAL